MSNLKSNQDLYALDNYKPKPQKDWQLHWLDDQPMLFSKSNDSVHLLNPVAGFIWTCCDGKTDVKAIRKALQEVFVDSQDEVAKDLPDTLKLWQEQELIDFEQPLKKRQHHKLCIGMATYDDFDGVYFSVQAIQLYHPEVADEIGILVVDNNPYGAVAEELQKLENAIPNYYYVPYTETTSTAVRDVIFREADADYVLCIDCHVLIMPGAIRKLIDFLDANPDCHDLLQGPMLRDDMISISTHMNPEWKRGMYGTWGNDERGKDTDAEPFEIPLQGMGLFACRKEAWLGFNPRFRGFGGEEGYIHEKFRQRGNRTLCLPFLRWLHRFQRPLKVPYNIKWEDRIYNYLVGFDELNLDNTKELEQHFVEIIGEKPTQEIITQVQQELDNPFHYFDAIYCINLDFQTERWQAMQERFSRLQIEKRVRRFSAIETIENQHIGCALSHRQIVEKAKRQGLNHVLVLEDDALFLDDIVLHLQRSLKELKSQDWKVFYLGGTKWGQTYQKMSGCQYLEPKMLTSTHALAYHHSFFDEMLENIPHDIDSMKIWLQTHRAIDQWLAKSIQPQGGCFISSPVVASQPVILGQESPEHGDKFS